MNLLEYKNNNFSQNGEDGIIEQIFKILEIEHGFACEFGAWDGIHFSNTRKLILSGWKSIMIEADNDKFTQLTKNYSDNKDVKCVNSYIDTENNTIDNILHSNGVDQLDFISIDIDGLDFEIFHNMKIRPTVVCVEVNAGFSPTLDQRLSLDIAKENIGQPLGTFCQVAQNKGYYLVCYSGNAFFIKNEYKERIQPITAIEAYLQFLDSLSLEEKDWLYWVNRKLETPYYDFNNSFLSAKNLGLNPVRLALRSPKFLLRRALK